MSTDDDRQRHPIGQAQALVSDWVIPDAASQSNKLSHLVALLGAAGNLEESQANLEVDSSLLAPEHKVAYDLLRKYKVLVDPDTLSESAIARLRSRKNYPRWDEKTTLREWSDAVLGYGEQVDFYLPCHLRRNTRLGTVQRMSQKGGDLINELLASVQVIAPDDYSDVHDEELCASTIGVQQEPDSAFQAEMDAIRAADCSGLQLLDSLMQNADNRWSPTVHTCIGELLDSGRTGSELELMIRLLDRLDQVI